ncbi:uncharacterized protein V1518DRAFT_375561 [Limtongia smithiae]|uniref:uncharacterized protein n=1 Tax=Limtongia smithiae TaxID=1125753 RepID=UPI0034CF17C9
MQALECDAAPVQAVSRAGELTARKSRYVLSIAEGRPAVGAALAAKPVTSNPGTEQGGCVQDVATHTTVVISRPSILSDVTNTAGSGTPNVSRRSSKIVNRRISLQIPNDVISAIDDAACTLLHQVDGTFSFPPSIAAIETYLFSHKPEAAVHFMRHDEERAGRMYNSDLLRLITQRLAVQQQRFLDDMYTSHDAMCRRDGRDVHETECDTVCFAMHLYGKYTTRERLELAALAAAHEDEDEEEVNASATAAVTEYLRTGNLSEQKRDLRYLQYAALWRHIAEESDLEGPHTAAAWWALAELRFRVMKARLRHSGIDETNRFLQGILEMD